MKLGLQNYTAIMLVKAIKFNNNKINCLQMYDTAQNLVQIYVKSYSAFVTI